MRDKNLGNIRVPADLLDRLDGFVTAHGEMTRSAVVRLAITTYLDAQQA